MRRGFTLLEVMIAGAILAIGALGVLGMLVTVIDNNRASRDRTTAITIAELRLAQLQADDSSIMADMAAAGNIDSTTADNPYTRLCSQTNNAWKNPFKAADSSKPLMVNAFGDDCTGRLDAANCSVGDRRFAVGTYVIPTGIYTDFVRGEIRVVWRERSSSTCNTFTAFGNVDTKDTRMASATAGCDFVSIPFALRKQASAVLEGD